MPMIRLIHWNQAESFDRARRLRDEGFAVNHDPIKPDGHSLRDDIPDVYVIDLSRLPSHGREIAGWLRKYKKTRHIPLVFVDGEKDKVQRVRSLLPDATYTTWPKIGAAVHRALANPPANPVVPNDEARYAGTPLPKKLGIKEGCRVVLLDAPPKFEQSLGELPDRVQFCREMGDCDLAMWFVTSEKQLLSGVKKIAKTLGDALWICWPKQTSGVVTDVTDRLVRATGLANGLVDYKICAVDKTWSGLKFARRK